jgi:type VI secretion system secreted protein VgrG
MEIAEELLGVGAGHVTYDLSIGGEDASFVVFGATLEERVSQLYEATVHAHTDQPIVVADLVGKNVTLTLERHQQRRVIRGIAQTAVARPTLAGWNVTVHVVPALYLLSHIVDWRIYQDITVPELVEQLVNETLGERKRKVRLDTLSDQYPRHEYLVQHGETHLEFLTRLCDEEGIFFYFDHEVDDEEHEVLVLADTNDNRPSIIGSGQVDYTDAADHPVAHDIATAAHNHEELGATDVVVSSFDWSNPKAELKVENVERGRWGAPRLEEHHHFAQVRDYAYADGSGQYGSHTTSRLARHNIERLDVGRRSWTVSTNVITAVPGHTFKLSGTQHMDDEYLILAVRADGTANRSGRGEYVNTLEVVPKSMPYRPPLPARRVMPGPETATVVGPANEEIHTDRHGRVKVQFHWDRRGQRDEHSSAWIRVAQGWAGPGYGSMFIPRVGMEVMIQFLGGDPSRPIVTGCLYNGSNDPPYTLPDHKTRSTIKTNSSVGGGGYNELRFDDKKGSEEVWIHAERDFNEVVEHDHSTRVKNEQTNTVDANQTETIGQNQMLRVKNDRKKVVDKDETNVVEGSRTTSVRHDEKLTVEKGERLVSVATGKDTEEFLGGRETTVNPDDELSVGANKRVAVGGVYDIDVEGRFRLEQASANKLVVDNQILANSIGKIELDAAQGAAKASLEPSGVLTLESTAEIRVKVGGSTITVTPSGVTITCQTFRVNGQALTEINGTIVKIN